MVPGGRKRRKKLLPLQPTSPHPGPHLRPQGPSKQDGGGGREGRARAQAVALDQPGQLGDGALPQEGPRKPGVSPGPRGKKTPRESCREFFPESLFGVIFSNIKG